MDAHSENDTTAQDESTESWQSTRPQCEKALLFHDASSTVEAVSVFALGLDGLHPRLDGVQGHGDVPRAWCQ